ncbi:MAG: hypothetical protein QXS29_10100 [Nitrososphaeria archaeon]
MIVNRKPVTEYTCLGANPIVADREYRWQLEQIGTAIQPICVYGKGQPGQIESAGLSLWIGIESKELFWFNLGTLRTIIGHTFYYRFPELVIPKTATIAFRSTVSLDYLYILSETVFVQEVLPSV